MSSPPRVHSVSGDLKEGKFKSFYTKINMEHNNGGFEDDFPFQLGDFQVPC